MYVSLQAQQTLRLSFSLSIILGPYTVRYNPILCFGGFVARGKEMNAFAKDDGPDVR